MRDRLPDAEREKIAKWATLTLYDYSSEAKEALEYLTINRGLSENIIRDFCIGYVPRSVRNEFGDIHEFAGRITIPIFDQYGDIIAISSRDWRKDAYRKFWHESYPKSLHLFALSLAKKHIIKYNLCIVVEGEFDVFSLHECGMNCAVGTVGASLSLYQLSVLKRYCDDFYFAFDGDEAGEKAINRVLKLSRKYNLRGCDINLIPVYLPKDSDPDSIIRQQGKSTFVQILKDAKIKAKERYLYG